MASKMKNGLFRIQCYLTEEAFEIFNQERKAHNQNQDREAGKLSESGFCHLKLTGNLPLLRGAPKGNKNAVGRRQKREDSVAQNTPVFPAEKHRSRLPSVSFGEDHLSICATELAEKKSSAGDSKSSSEKPPSMTAAPPENRDDFSTNRQKVLENNYVSKKENKSTFKDDKSAKKSLSQRRESDGKKMSLAEDDFEQLIESIDRWGEPAESNSNVDDQAAIFYPQQDCANVETNTLPPPISERPAEQPSLF